MNKRTKNMTTGEHMAYEQLILKRVKLAAQKVFTSEQMVQDLTVSTKYDLAFMDLIVQLQTFVLAEEITTKTEQIIYSHPRDWWQMLKEQHAPHWFIRLFPIEKIHKEWYVEFRQDATFPKFAKSYDFDREDIRMRISSYQQEVK